MSLKYRIAIILGLIAASIWTLFPRTVVERVKRNGEFVYDTVRRVPLKRGLDLQGGMHLALEVDPRTLLSFEDVVFGLSEDEEPPDEFHFPLT